MPKNKTPTEYDECVAFKCYLDILTNQGKILCYSHIPSETFTRNWGTKMKNKRMGVQKGVPDYIIATHKNLVFVEMKRTKGGVLSEEQKTWLDVLRFLKIPAAVCNGFEEAKKFVDDNVTL